MLNLIEKIRYWRKTKYVPNKEFEIHWNEIHILIVGDYFSHLPSTCDFPKLLHSAKLLTNNYSSWNLQMVGCFTEELKEMFLVPKPKDTQNRIKLIEAFLSFIVQLLYHKTDLMVANRVENLEHELRCVLTILVDISWMLLDEVVHVADLEAVANQAGSFVHSLLFSTDPVQMDERKAAVLNHIHLLTANLQTSGVITRPSYYTSDPRTPILNSFLVVDSLVDDLEDLLRREDDRIADVHDQITLLHSLINDVRSPQPCANGMLHLGDIAHQAQYLITAFLVKDAPLWYVAARLTHFNNQIEGIRKDISQDYIFQGLNVKKSFTKHPPFQGESNDVIIGFEEKTRDILDQLVGGGKQSLQVMSISGMAGLGKTTLAKKLFNHPCVRYSFTKLSWCVISHTFEIRRLLADILSHINSELWISNMEEETLVEQIYKTLIGRRYLVVLDDMWESNVWYELRRCFPDDGNGSRILITSRNKDVAPPNSMNHELPFLSDEQCWELLQMKAFSNRSCPPELQQIGKKIAARCCGLPLTVVVVAGVLSTVDEEEGAWEEVRGSLASYIHEGKEDSVMQILELSYIHLQDYLKPCFLHIGSYEEDQEISVGKLKRLWVAEGLIHSENAAVECLTELINRSLVIVAKRRSDGRGVKTCIVHDLLRDLCLKKCKEESFILKYSDSDCHEATPESSATMSLCQHVRSCYANRQCSSSYVGDMRVFRVVNLLSYFEDSRRFFGIEYLVNLRFLVIGEMPESMEKLQNLEYLRVVSSSSVLPGAIMKMKKLRHVHARDAKYGKDWSTNHLPDETNHLEYLSQLVITNLSDEELLKYSPHLSKLKCSYEVKESLEYGHPHFDLRFLTRLRSLALNFQGLRSEEFGFPSNIRKLLLHESRLSWEKMGVVGRLEHLEVLKLKCHAVVGERWDTRDDEFQNLRFLLLEVIELSEWNVDSNDHFPNLQHLSLRNCFNLQEIPSEIGYIATLEVIEVKGRCLSTVSESAERIKEEQWDNGNEHFRVIINTKGKR